MTRRPAPKPKGREVDPKDKAFGARVKKFRQDRGMTQAELASTLSKTASWMSQVERGIQPVERLDVLQELADNLGVSVQQLRPGAPLPRGASSEAPQELIKSNDLDEARRLISGHPAVEALLQAEAPSGPTPSLEELAASVEEVWELTHDGQFADVSALVTELVPALERCVRTVDGGEQSAAYLLLARMYQALAAAFVRQDQADAAWVAADRAIWAAERSGQPLHVCAGVFRMVQAFVRLKHLDQAEHAATSAITALEGVQEMPPEGLSVVGSLYLARALVHARGGRRTEAKEEISKARGIAKRIGADRNDFNLEFGPTNVEIQAVATAVDLGDAGEALDIGLAIDAETLSPERQGRLLMDLGRAHAQRRHPGEALDCLLRAEALSPETIQTHMAARAAIKELVLIAGPTAPPELLALAERADALE
ncbi:helix-turn-helix domain-containing protein [Streptomyces sp. AC1-42T]|uniref:helix-turn-helix domain-containing protein n=1 Tax=Streptomyces sp. AC1-42T TaxID=2218665 RepID=UPI000DADFD41|nr:helix-turn-helix transcriptional regulator [Streptomyces sp. AC1-42T]PZT71551.1 transcriptional regulator [Streptomyces sp. AC1-42T]